MSDLPPPRFAVVINGEAGSIARIGADEVVAGLEELFSSQGIAAEIEIVTPEKVAEALARAAARDVSAVLVGGGDGTVSAAATALCGTGKALGILPLGTFNLAARDLGSPLEWQEAALALCGANERDIDLLDIEGARCLCLAVLGFYPALALSRPADRGTRIGKMWRNLRDVVTRLMDYPALDLAFTDEEGTTVRHRSRLVVIANNDYADVFGLIPHRESLDAGRFTVYVSKHHSRLALVRSFFLWVSGRWRGDHETLNFRATQLEIRVRDTRRIPVMRDGEFDRLTLPLRVRLLPKALRVLVPRPPERRDAGDGGIDPAASPD